MPHDLPDDDWLPEERRRVGASIREARLDRNLTQEQVYLAVPTTRSNYQKIEAGAVNPSLDMLLRVARVIGMPIWRLLGHGR
ncbi:helix-turn-helix domain-containing protein [Streptomyces sp. NPDC008150]|uniref:helix-turn-helix domain-containing protein n=1 Tax=Streptomyces sp. NPDC008150 TaxID=3364816 RepID=UPI0036EF2B8C